MQADAKCRLANVPDSIVWEMAGEPALRQAGICISLGQLRNGRICEALGPTPQSTLDYYGRTSSAV